MIIGITSPGAMGAAMSHATRIPASAQNAFSLIEMERNQGSGAN